MPRVDDSMDRIAAATFIIKEDLVKGYWQAPSTERGKEISIQVNCKSSDEPWSVTVPVTSTLVTGYDVYHEEGLCEVLSGDVTPSLTQGLRHYLFNKLVTFSVRDARRFPAPS